MKDLKWHDDIYFEVLAERLQLDAELANKDDSTLVEDLLYASSDRLLPADCEKLLKDFISGRQLRKSERKRLEGLYKLVFGKESLGYSFNSEGKRELL